MLNKKSFDLNKDEKKTKPTERLYQPKKFRWCKYIVIPLLFGFILLLILTNVDFTGEAYNQTALPPNGRMFTPDNTIRSTLSQIKSSISRALNCIQSTDSCSLTCVGGNINNIYKQLEPLYKSCNRDLDLILIDCSIPSGRLKNDFFEGNYRLKSVNISNCNLSAIQNKAFAPASVSGLKNLTLINSGFVTLEKSTFEGLQQLEYFHLINKISWSTFKGNGFLAYFAETLISLVIQQKTSATSVYDPLPWLQGAEMKRLTHVNLANNNFQHVLKATTFATLMSVQNLSLSNCSLTYLESNVFDNILSSLKHLDLSNNRLTVLSGDMLWHMSGLELNLSFNHWQCTCDNKEMLQIIKWKSVDIVFMDEKNIKCYTPVEWKDISVDDLVLDCLISTTTVITETTIAENTEQETEGTTTITTTTSIVNPCTTTTTTKITNRPINTTTVTSSETSSDSSSSGQTSEEIETEMNETTSETITTTTTPRTTRLTTTSTPVTRTTAAVTTTTAAAISTTTTAASTTTTTTNRPEKTTIFCYNADNKLYSHPILKEKCAFSIRPLSATSVKIVTTDFISHMGILYFSNSTNVNVVSNTQRQQREYFTLINNLNSSEMYTFCLVQQLKQLEMITETYNLKISPFDCRSYSRPEVFPQPWLEQEDQVWIVSLVVLGTCLMVFLGIILVVAMARYRKHKKTKYERTLNEDLEKEPNYLEPSNGLTNQTSDATLRPNARLYISQHQPPDIVAQHVNCNSHHDLYEELLM